MEIRIMSCQEAGRHVPLVPTLAVRIYNSHKNPIAENLPGRIRLRRSLLYTVLEYSFDDYNPEMWRKLGLCERDIEERLSMSTVIDGALAERLELDYLKNSPGKNELLVHCHQGAARSPAVAIAFNDIFGLGHDGAEMRSHYPHFNTYVYNELIKAAERLGIRA